MKIRFIRIFDESNFLIKRFKKNCEADLRRTGRRTQAGLTPGKDDNDVWHKADRKDTEWFYLRIVSVKNKYEKDIRRECGTSPLPRRCDTMIGSNAFKRIARQICAGRGGGRRRAWPPARMTMQYGTNLTAKIAELLQHGL